PVANDRPSGEKATENMCPCPVSTCWSASIAGSQIVSPPSASPAAINLPLGETATQKVRLLGTCRFCFSLPETTSQILICPSSPTEARNSPSRLKHRLHTPFVCPSSL